MSRIAPYPLRMAPEQREYLEKEAEKSKRSLQQEILYRLDKFQQIEKLLSSSPSDTDDMFMQVANALRMAKVADERAREIEKLKGNVDELMASLRLSETDKFMAISNNAEIIEKAIKNILAAIPPNFSAQPKANKKPT